MPALEPTLARDPLVGSQLGEYLLVRRIGSGGMGTVYEALQQLIGRRVAIKVLRPHAAGEPEHVQRLLAEARAANAIRHRGIIDIFGFGQIKDAAPYIVMEYLEGSSLDAILAERGSLPPVDALSILVEVLDALDAAHAAHVIHRDIKTSNIFMVVGAKGARYVKLLDFGLAKRSKLSAEQTRITKVGMVVGTPEYMSPEQALDRDVGAASDLYSLGVVAFEVLTGRLPFRGTAMECILQHVNDPPPRPSSLVAGIPPALEAVVLEMLAKDPLDRPQSAEVIGAELRRLRKLLSLDSTRLELPITRGPAWGATTLVDPEHTQPVVHPPDDSTRTHTQLVVRPPDDSTQLVVHTPADLFGKPSGEQPAAHGATNCARRPAANLGAPLGGNVRGTSRQTQSMATLRRWRTVLWLVAAVSVLAVVAVLLTVPKRGAPLRPRPPFASVSSPASLPSAPLEQVSPTEEDALARPGGSSMSGPKLAHAPPEGPTREQLLLKINDLELRVRRESDGPDPVKLAFLDRFRKQVDTAREPAARKSLADTLSKWECRFLSCR